MNAEHFFIDGHEAAAAPYHYRECGLDNIYLANGFRHEEYDGEDYVTIENVDGLWKAIGFFLVTMPRTLEPKEIRFLRQQMDATQAELAQMLRVDAQTVARWEKGKTEIPGPADVSLRFLMLGCPVMQPEGGVVLDRVDEFVKSITGKDADGPERTLFTREGDEWHGKLAA